VSCRPSAPKSEREPIRANPNRASLSRRARRWRSMKRALVRDQDTRSAPRLPRTTNGVRREHRIAGIPCVVLIPLPEQAPRVFESGVFTHFPDRLRSPSLSLVRGFVVHGRARFAETSLCHHVLNASFIVAEGRILRLSPRWPTEHAPMAPLVARSPPVRPTQAPFGG
jgi:hypothetical protein